MITHDRTRKAFILHVDLDPVGGVFHTPRSAYEIVQSLLDRYIPHYAPVAIFAMTHPAERQKNDRKRVCFVINVDLDPVPGAFHTQESAQNILRNVFVINFSHYNPIVSLAPANIQPTCH